MTRQAKSAAISTVTAMIANDQRRRRQFTAVPSVRVSASVLTHLGMAAYYHAGPHENQLGVGHTVPIGEGWVEGSPLDALLVSLPYLWGPKLEHCLLPDRHIQVLWLILINEAERAYKQAHGADALAGLLLQAERATLAITATATSVIERAVSGVMERSSWWWHAGRSSHNRRAGRRPRRRG
jgi:Suppressor of fused protein (SUFU).